MISEPALDRLAGMFRAPDLSGTRYALRSLLGRGGMGAVYLAHDKVLDRDVALKIVDRAGAPGGPRVDSAGMLTVEARILAALEHPGIVPVHDFGELPDGRVFYAMKRVRGERLDRWLAAGHDVAERLAVFTRVCDAIAFAHAHGVVHRDLKPENIMIGEFGEVLVLDWGIALVPGRPIEEHGAQGVVAGTPDYMAPEQRRGDRTVDYRADIYALGVVLDRMGGPAPIAAIAGKARAADPSARYQSVQQLAADVQRYLAGRAVEAHRERLVDRLARVWRRYKLPILVVLTYLAARLLLIWLAHV
jgi:serine/threonine protein kinase